MRPLGGSEKEAAAAREGMNLGKSEGGADLLKLDGSGLRAKAEDRTQQAARRRARKEPGWLLAGCCTRRRRSKGQDLPALGQRHVKGVLARDTNAQHAGRKGRRNTDNI